jgi:hypothetical protein
MREFSNRDQRVMPGVAPIIDALAARTQESMQRADRIGPPTRGDYDEKGPRFERIKRLARQRVALERADAQRQRTWARLEHAQERSAAAFADIDVSQIVEPLAGVFVDPARFPARNLDDVAKRRERTRLERDDWQ